MFANNKWQRTSVFYSCVHKLMVFHWDLINEITEKFEEFGIP